MAVTKKELAAKIALVNEIYKLDYEIFSSSYPRGYRMVRYTKDKCINKEPIGFDGLKSAKEFAAYLDGLIMAANYFKN